MYIWISFTLEILLWNHDKPCQLPLHSIKHNEHSIIYTASLIKNPHTFIITAYSPSGNSPSSRGHIAETCGTPPLLERYPISAPHTRVTPPSLNHPEELRSEGSGDCGEPSVEREIIFHTGSALSDARYRSNNLNASTTLVANLSPLVNSYYSNISLAGGLTEDLGGSPISMRSRDMGSPGMGAGNLVSIFPHLNTIITNKSSGEWAPLVFCLHFYQFFLLLSLIKLITWFFFFNALYLKLSLMNIIFFCSVVYSVLTNLVIS